MIQGAETMQEAPGTLDAEAQRRLMAQIIQLVRASFGPDAHLAMTVMREVDHGAHLAVYSMGTVSGGSLGWMFRTAAQHLPESQMRALEIEDEPRVEQ